jgi:hypothetical protein
MKRAVGIVCLAVSLNAAAADSRYCEMLGSLAKSIAEDHAKGVSYKAELGKLTGAGDGLPANVLQLTMTMAKTIYIDMPKLTPEGAYKLHYVACMAS